MQATGEASARRALIGIWRITLAVFVIATLYFGQSVLIPLALAFLLTFILSPVVTWLQRWIGQTLGILLVVAALFTLIGGTGWLLGQQLLDVGRKMPDYTANIAGKLRAFQIPSGGALARLSGMIEELKKELPGGEKPSPEKEQAEKLEPKPPTASATPVPVRVVESAQSEITQLAQTAFVFLLGPLGRTGLVLLLLVFMLFEREDLRGRLIRLISQGDLRSTTLAMEDAGNRMAHYLRMQLLVNTAYGFSVAVGLYFIGIPNAALWGALSGLLRYIPYVGVWIAAAAPLALSLAISSSWHTPLITLGLFVILELIEANIVEPWLYGTKTGITPVALIIGAVFWTWIWGPIGLLLTNPLMVCLVVLGRHVPSVKFLSILLSDQKALHPHEEFYIRLLAVDPDEPPRFIDDYLKEHSLTELCDSVIIPAISLIEVDYRRGTLDGRQRGELLKNLEEIIEYLEVQPIAPPSDAGEPSGTPPLQPDAAQARRILSLPAHTDRDSLAAQALSRLLQKHGGIVATTTPADLSDEALSDLMKQQTMEAVCISVVAPSKTTDARNRIAKIRAHFPELKIGVLLLRGVEKETEASKSLRDAGADAIFISLAQCLEWLAPQAKPESPQQPPEDA